MSYSAYLSPYGAGRSVPRPSGVNGASPIARGNNVTINGIVNQAWIDAARGRSSTCYPEYARGLHDPETFMMRDGEIAFTVANMPAGHTGMPGADNTPVLTALNGYGGSNDEPWMIQMSIRVVGIVSGASEMGSSHGGGNVAHVALFVGGPATTDNNGPYRIRGGDKILAVVPPTGGNKLRFDSGRPRDKTMLYTVPLSQIDASFQMPAIYNLLVEGRMQSETAVTPKEFLTQYRPMVILAETFERAVSGIAAAALAYVMRKEGDSDEAILFALEEMGLNAKLYATTQQAKMQNAPRQEQHEKKHREFLHYMMSKWNKHGKREFLFDASRQPEVHHPQRMQMTLVENRHQMMLDDLLMASKVARQQLDSMCIGTALNDAGVGENFEVLLDKVGI